MKVKYCIVIALVVGATVSFAGRCQICGANIIENRAGFCSTCKYTPRAKQIQAEEKRRKQNEEAKKELLENERKPLKLKKFLGFEFLSNCEQGVSCSTVKLEKPFRKFNKAQLYYTDIGRLFCVTISNTFENCTCEDIKNEVTAIAHILEKKYNFTFPGGVKSSDGIHTIGGAYNIATRTVAHKQIFDSGKSSYFATRKWADFTIELKGVFYRSSGCKNDSFIFLKVWMPEVKQADKKKQNEIIQNDESGIDVL